MRTRVEVDAELLAEAMRLSGARTRRQAVDESLRLTIRLKALERIRALRGKLRWTGDLESMRRD